MFTTKLFSRSNEPPKVPQHTITISRSPKNSSNPVSVVVTNHGQAPVQLQYPSGNSAHQAPPSRAVPVPIPSKHAQSSHRLSTSPMMQSIQAHSSDSANRNSHSRSNSHSHSPSQQSRPQPEHSSARLHRHSHQPTRSDAASISAASHVAVYNGGSSHSTHHREHSPSRHHQQREQREHSPSQSHRRTHSDERRYPSSQPKEIKSTNSATWLAVPDTVPYGSAVPLATTPVPAGYVRQRSVSATAPRSSAPIAIPFPSTSPQSAQPNSGHKRSHSASTPRVSFSSSPSKPVLHTPPVTPPYSTPRLAVVNPPPVAQPLGGYQTAYISTSSPGQTYMVGSLPTNMTSNLAGHSPTMGTPRLRTHSQSRSQQYHHAEQHVYARPKGFFNRRGDEFIRKGVVRRQAHSSMEWHPMFKDYPNPGQGWMDEEGNWIAERGGILKH